MIGWLNEQGYGVHRKRIARLVGVMAVRGGGQARYGDAVRDGLVKVTESGWAVWILRV